MKKIAFPALIALLALLLPVSGQDTPPTPAPDEAAAPAPVDEGPVAAAEGPKLHTPAPADLVLRAEREGRIASVVQTKVRVIAEEYGGPFRVQEVLREAGPVAEGDVLVRFDLTWIDRALREARESLEDVQVRLRLAKEDMENLRTNHRILLEKTEKGRLASEHEAEIFEKYEGPEMLKSADLGLQSRENRLADEKEELAQLEMLYQGTQLASETKEIVLQRARRDVKIGEAWLELARNDRTVVLQFRYPDRKQKIADELRWATHDLARVREEIRIGETRREREVRSAERTVRDAEEHLARLEADKSAMAVVAPVAGILSDPGMEPGDRVSNNHVWAVIHDPESLEVHIGARAEDLRVLSVGRAVQVSLPEYAEVALQGSVTRIAPMGSADDGGTQFDTVVSLSGRNDLVRLGLRCRVVAESEPLTEVLAIPRKAVKTQDGKTTVTVWADGKGTEREVTLGGGNPEMVQVLSGLAAGEAIVLEPAKKE